MAEWSGCEHGEVEDGVHFPADLYAGAAEYYERCRPGWPQELLEELVERARVTGQGSLLDLACGTGQVAFGLCRHFEQVWAVDQEAEMVRVGRAKAENAGILNIRWITCAAEDLDTDPGSFELITVGNAFHRLRRQEVAEKALDWLKPGGCLALLWGWSPWRGSEGWQSAMSKTLDRWVDAAGTSSRIPHGWKRARAARPDLDVLRDAGFEVLGRFGVSVTQEWTPDGLVGFVYSTSLLPRSALGERAGDFEADVRRHLAQAAGSGPYVQATEFACELSRRR
jgi:SAM-dependent methyltransferase